MHQFSSALVPVSDRDPMPTGAGTASAIAMQTEILASSASGTAPSIAHAKEQAERLAELSDSARRLNRPQQADRFLLLAWLAFDSGLTAEPEACAPVA
jgi:hypothetical protein